MKIAGYGPLKICLSIVLLLLLLEGCSFYVGDISDLVPKPEDVAIKKPPEITNCEATFQLTNKRDQYDQICDWCWDPWWGWYWCCWSVWVWTDVWGQVNFKISTNDPSDDLNINKSPRIRIMDSEPASGISTTGVCLLDIDQQDIVLSQADITGAGSSKIVTIKLKNTYMRFTSQCKTFAANIPLRIIFEDCGQDMYSLNECRATIKITQP